MIDARNAYLRDVMWFLQEQVAGQLGGRAFNTIRGYCFVDTNYLSEVSTITYKASNVTVSVALHEMTQQIGLTTGIVHNALVIGSPRGIMNLKRLPSLPRPANRRLADLLNRRLKWEDGPCQAHVLDVLCLITQESGVPTDVGYTTEWPLLFCGQRCDMRVRDLLWWTGAMAGKEVVLTDDGVSFKEREGTVVTNAWFVPPATNIPEVALAVSVWPRTRQNHPGGGWETTPAFTNKTVYCLDLGFRPEQAQTKSEKAFTKGLARLGWSPKTESMKSPGVRSKQTYGKGARRLDVWIAYFGGQLTLAYWEEDTGPIPSTRP